VPYLSFEAIIYQRLTLGNGVNVADFVTADRLMPSHAYRKASMTWFFLSSSWGKILPVNGSDL
jgi:hypothetical protein